MPNRRKLLFASSTDGSRTHKRSRRFELRRFAGLRTVLSCPASPMGFEPTISCVTGRRALRAAPRGRIVMSVAQVGLEPTASLVLSQGGLPVAYRAAWCPERESNPQTLGFRPSHSASLAYLGVSSPGWSRTIVSWVWTKRRCRWTTGPRCSSGVTGSRTRISGLRNQRRPVGP